MHIRALAGIGFFLATMLSPASAFALTIIDDCTDLQNIDVNIPDDYALAGDIDCTGVDFTPIGTASTPFNTNFEGHNHVISNLTIDAGTGANAGLFGYTQDASINNVLLQTVTLTGGDNAGSLIGYALRTNVLHAGVSGALLSVGSDGGGMIGKFVSGNMSGAFVTSFSFDSAGGRIGGLIGTLSGGTVTDVYASGDNRVGDSVIGGLIGEMYAEGNVILQNAYAVGVVDVGSQAGGLIGNMDTPDGFTGTCRISNSFAAVEVNAGTYFSDFIHHASDSCDILNSAFLQGMAGFCIDTGGGGTVECTNVADITTFYSNVNEPLASWNFSTVWKTVSDTFPVLRWVTGEDVSSSSSSSSSSDESSSASSSSSSAGPVQSHGGGRRGGPGRGGSPVAFTNGPRSMISSHSTTSPFSTPELMSSMMRFRTCDRVMKWFRENNKMLERVNERLQKRFGFTCAA